MTFPAQYTTVFSICLLGFAITTSGQLITNEAEAALWFQGFDSLYAVVNTQYQSAAWTYNTNLTDFNLDAQVGVVFNGTSKKLAAGLERAKLMKEGAQNASKYDWQNFQDEDLKRQFSKIAIIGLAALEPEKVERADAIRGDMQKIYSTGKVCNKPGDDSGNCYPLDPDLTEILAKSDDWDEQLWAWEGWREETGKKMKDKYTEFIQYHNEAAVKEGFEDAGDYWRSMYETETFEEDVARIWEELKPLYQQLHYYVKNKLKKRYPDKPFPGTGHIPAHILGNMWAQSWANLYEYVVPYAGKETLDVTDALIEKGYDAKRMFEISEEFFTSLGLIGMPQKFWDHSMIEKPDDREVVCHASAWDFYNGEDFRIKQCTTITQESLVTIHHEMGHVEYYLQYKHHPVVYRRGANPGFHEAVGDVLALSVSTPEHLKEIGLVNEIGNDTESDLNFLFFMALKKIAFLPFGYMIDQWRWKVFRGDIEPDRYTEEWAKLRCELQGVSPPVKRTKDHFDPGAKYHIPGHTPYIRYFVSFIIQFQFHEALCRAAGHEGPLHRCDIYRSQEAGRKLGNMLKLGASKPWPDAMEQIAGQREMSAAALIKYFQPLTDWLKEQNGDADVTWDSACPTGSFHEEVNSACKQRTVGFLLLVVSVLFNIMQ